MTATAYRGASTGAKATNRLWSFSAQILLLREPELDIVGDDFRDDGNADSSQIVAARGFVGTGSFYPPTGTAEQIDLPAGVQSQREAAAVSGRAVEITAAVAAGTDPAIVEVDTAIQAARSAERTTQRAA